MRKGSKRAVRRGMRITADNRHAGQRRTLLGAYYMNDTLPNIVHVHFKNAELVTVIVERRHLNLRDGIKDAVDTSATLGCSRRDIVIGSRKVSIRSPRLTSR